MIKDILKDGFFYLVSKSIVGLLSILIIWLSLKIYGVDIYGKYSILYVFTLTISNLFFSWLAQSYIRMYQKDNEELYVTKMGFFYSILGCLCAIVIVSLYSDYNILYCSLLAISNGVYCVGRAILQSKREIKKFFYYDLLRIISQLILVYLFSLLYEDFKGLVYATSLSCLVFIFTFYRLLKTSKNIDYKKTLLSWIRFGTPVALWLTIASGQLLLDRKIISAFLSVNELGAYSALYDSITRMCALIVIPLSNACYPILVANNSDKISYRKLGLYMGGASLIIALLVALFTYIIYGFINTYYDIYFPRESITFLIFGIVLWQLGMLYQKPLEMQNNTIAMLFNIVFCLVVSGIINYLYVQVMGIYIFPITVSIGALLYLVMTLLWLKK